MKTNRRDFIRQLSLACGSVMFITSCDGYISPWRFFTEEEANTITAFAEQIIPADQDAGATDAGVINYIDKQLAGTYARYQTDYRKGIHAINESAVRIMRKPFCELNPDAQVHFMEQMESGNLPAEYWHEVSQQSFFNLVLDHTMQGFYGSPRHGGNKNYVSYKMMKIDYPHVIGRNKYQVKSVSGKTHVS